MGLRFLLFRRDYFLPNFPGCAFYTMANQNGMFVKNDTRPGFFMSMKTIKIPTSVMGKKNLP
jgi:hypothetical protein